LVNPDEESVMTEIPTDEHVKKVMEQIEQLPPATDQDRQRWTQETGDGQE
jgi:gluconate kinase